MAWISLPEESREVAPPTWSLRGLLTPLAEVPVAIRATAPTPAPAGSPATTPLPEPDARSLPYLLRLNAARDVLCDQTPPTKRGKVNLEEINRRLADQFQQSPAGWEAALERPLADAYRAAFAALPAGGFDATRMARLRDIAQCEIALMHKFARTGPAPTHAATTAP